MSDEDLRAKVAGVLDDCISYTDSVLSPEREKATDYYHGRPFGNEEDGRSQAVLTEVRDATHAVLPALLKIFFGPERAVEFVPRRPDQVVMAKQVTEYLHTVFVDKNSGFLRSHDCMVDAFVRRIGVFKYGWRDGEKVAYELKDVTDADLEKLAEDDAVDLIKITETGTRPAELAPPAAPQPPGAPPAPPAPPVKLHSVYCTVTLPAGPYVETVPPEEFVYSRGARSLESAECVAHRTELTLSELVAMGYDADEIKEHGTEDSTLRLNGEELARRPEGTSVGDEESGDESTRKYGYTETFIKIDFDGDKYAELRKVCTLGTGHYVLANKPATRRPFEIFVPRPEPHTITGHGMSDLTMDMQLLKSSIFRGQLDSLAAALFPRMGVVEGQVNINDVLNTEVGAPIRMRAPGMVQPLAVPFTGGDAAPMLDFVDSVIERRTGQRRGVADGLDMDALQSTSDQGVSAAVSAAQAQTELYARVFAEMTLKRLFRGLYQVIIENAPDKQMARLNGEFVEIDPRSWDPAMDLEVNVALGTTLTAQRLAALRLIISEQKEILSTLGMSNPLTTLGQYSQTLIRATELAGFKDAAGGFFNKLPLNYQPPEQPPQMTPEQTIAQAQIQIEQMKVQKELEIQQAKLTLDTREKDRQFERQLAQDAADLALRKLEIEYKYAAGNIQREFEQDQARDAQVLEGHKAVADFAIQSDAHEHEKQMSQAQQEHDQQLARDQQAHDQEMAERQTAAQEQAAASQEGTSE